MPFSERQRRAGFAELGRRKKGLAEKSFKGMDKGELDEYVHSPLEKKKKKRGLVERK